MMFGWPAADVTLQVVAVPEQPPDHPVKRLPSAGAAVSVTAVPEGNVAEHVDPQLIPAGVDVTVPEPVPARDTVMNGPLTIRVTPVVPASSLPALSVPFAVMMRVSVLRTADAVEVMLSWTVPLVVVIVAGLKRDRRAVGKPRRAQRQRSRRGCGPRERHRGRYRYALPRRITFGVNGQVHRNERGLALSPVPLVCCSTAAARGGEDHAGTAATPGGLAIRVDSRADIVRQ